MNIEQKCLKLKQSKKWKSPVADSSVDAKHVAMIASNNANDTKDSNDQNALGLSPTQLAQFSHTSDKDTLCETILMMNNASNQSSKNRRNEHKKKPSEPQMLIKKKPNEPLIKTVHGKKAAHCNFCK